MVRTKELDQFSNAAWSVGLPTAKAHPCLEKVSSRGMKITEVQIMHLRICIFQAESLRCSMNFADQANAHETKIRRWTTFASPQSTAHAAHCGLVFAPAFSKQLLQRALRKRL